MNYMFDVVERELTYTPPQFSDTERELLEILREEREKQPSLRCRLAGLLVSFGRRLDPEVEVMVPVRVRA
jgi:hypothetical protein